jgi:hypothetical protein
VKWIGTHIWDWVTRFRNDVYIENISEVSASDHVVGIDNDGKLTKFDTPVPGTGGSTLDNAITVTNNDGGFSHIANTTISAATTITNVLDSILTPYNNTTITLNSLEFAKRASASTWYAPTSTSKEQQVEIGQHFQITTLAYTVATPSQTTDASVDFRVGSTDIAEFQGGTDNNTSAQQLTSAYVVTDDVVNTDGTYKSGDVYAFNVVAIDSGSGSNVEIQSNYINVTVLNRVKVGGSLISSISSNTEAQVLWNGLSGAYSNLAVKGDILVTADADMDTANKYTFIIYPNDWGSISNILHNDGQSVLSDFDSGHQKSIENGFGVTIPYRIYRSIYADAFAQNSTLKISF